MTFIERIKKDKITFDRLKTRKDKINFLWDYYKIPILSICLALIVFISLFVNFISKKPVLMNVVLVNSDAQIMEVNDEVFTTELEKAGIDINNKVVDINDYLTIGVDIKEENDAETLQVLSALFTISDLDIFVGFKNDFDRFIEADAFLDLSQYIDADLLEKADLYKYNDSMGNEIVGGIILHENSLLHKANYYHSEVIVGIASNASNIDNSLVFISQLIKD